MNEPSRKLQHRTGEQSAEQAQQQQQQQQSAVREFSSVEELIRHDAAATDVPPAVGERLRESLAKEPAPAKPWWKRLFS